MAHIIPMIGFNKNNSSSIANRKNGVSVDDENTDHCEANWFSTKSTQKHVQLQTNTVYVKTLCTSVISANYNDTFGNCMTRNVVEIEISSFPAFCCYSWIAISYYYVAYSLSHAVFTRSSKRSANFQQMYSKYTCKCWTFAGSCKHPISFLMALWFMTEKDVISKN